MVIIASKKLELLLSIGVTKSFLLASKVVKDAFKYIERIHLYDNVLYDGSLLREDLIVIQETKQVVGSS